MYSQATFYSDLSGVAQLREFGRWLDIRLVRRASAALLYFSFLFSFVYGLTIGSPTVCRAFSLFFKDNTLRYGRQRGWPYSEFVLFYCCIARGR